MMYRCVDQLQEEAGISPICELLEVSRSGYYASRKRQSAPAKACPITVRADAIFRASERTYGSRRIQAALKDQGVVEVGMKSLMAAWTEERIRSII
jgi:hypothetical protein